jgi:hypothetical protein
VTWLEGPRVWLDRSIRLSRAAIRGLGRHFVPLGLMDAKDSSFYTWFGWLYAWVVFGIVLVLPTWPGEPVVLFTAFLALAGAWLIAVPLTMDSISGADLALLGRGLKRLGADLKAAADEEGLTLPQSPAAEGKRAASVTGRLAAYFTPFVVLQLIQRQTFRAVLLPLVAVIGLLVGPPLGALHIGYWSPVALLFGLAVPLALRLIVMLYLPVLFLMYLAALKTDQAARRIK